MGGIARDRTSVGPVCADDSIDGACFNSLRLDQCKLSIRVSAADDDDDDDGCIVLYIMLYHHKTLDLCTAICTQTRTC